MSSHRGAQGRGPTSAALASPTDSRYHEFMKHDNEKRRRAPRVAEPVQVYLETSDRARLDRLTARLGATKSDVLRRGLEALEAMTRSGAGTGARLSLPTFRGQGLLPGVDLDDSASLVDLMDRNDATR